MKRRDVTHIRVSSLRQNTNQNLTDTALEFDTAFTQKINTKNTESPQLTLEQVEDIKLAIIDRHSIAELSKRYNVSMLTICECLLQ